MCGSAWCGRLTVTQEIQMGSIPIRTAKILIINQLEICDLVKYEPVKSSINVAGNASACDGLTESFSMKL